MADYRLTIGTNVLRTTDNTVIPAPVLATYYNEDRTSYTALVWTPDWQTYQDWLAAGNIPDPA